MLNDDGLINRQPGINGQQGSHVSDLQELGHSHYILEHNSPDKLSYPFLRGWYFFLLGGGLEYRL